MSIRSLLYCLIGPPPPLRIEITRPMVVDIRDDEAQRAVNELASQLRRQTDTLEAIVAANRGGAKPG